MDSTRKRKLTEIDKNVPLSKQKVSRNDTPLKTNPNQKQNYSLKSETISLKQKHNRAPECCQQENIRLPNELEKFSVLQWNYPEAISKRKEAYDLIFVEGNRKFVRRNSSTETFNKNEISDVSIIDLDDLSPEIQSVHSEDDLSLPEERFDVRNDNSEETEDDISKDDISDDDSDSTLKSDDFSPSEDENDSTLKYVNSDNDDTGYHSLLVSETHDGAEKGSESEFDDLTEDEKRELPLAFHLDYLDDIMLYELEKDRKNKLSKEFCNNGFKINADRRMVLIEWLVDVQVKLNGNNSAIHLAVTLMDLLLDKIDVPVDEMQCAAAAAFWVAVKLIHGNLNAKSLLEYTEGVVKLEDLCSYEFAVLKTSSFLQEVGGDVIVIFNFLLYKLYGFKYPCCIYYAGQYLLEIMLLEVRFANCTAHERAVTAVLTSTRIIKEMDVPVKKNLNITKFLTFNPDLQFMHKHLMKILKTMYSNQKQLTKMSVYRKYTSKRYKKISIHDDFRRLGL